MKANGAAAERIARRILLVEDEPSLVTTLSDRLRSESYDVESIGDGERALAHPGAGFVDLLILDVMLPGKSGFDVCRELRQRGIQTPILMLTARSQVVDRVVGLRLGADDYLTKPFDPDELHARVRVGQRMLALLANIKQLSGLLPICSYCKRIRGDDQYWQQVEGYIAEHSDAQFSHGICPPCYEQVSAEIDELSRMKPPRA